MDVQNNVRETIEIVWTFEEDGKLQNSKMYTAVECQAQEEKGEA